ncbi:PqqD family protein [Halomonas denitrificans]|uniref:PqqD family protein n=1 Tax=Halomonas denitrificans TaxID=370769 RepID=UPI00130044C3|nr:PqqD family protein [Halomonas denitrificans]
MNGPPDPARRVEALQPAGLEATLRLEGAPELAEALRAAMPGWPLAPVPAAARPPSCEALTAWREAEGYGQAVPGRSRPRRLLGLATAAASLIADLIPRLLEARPRQSGLHCAAVEIDGRLVLFPATHRAGKSLLCAAFAAAGHRVFADDVLLLSIEDGGMAVGEALGIAPRLRLPLPTHLPAALADFIAAHERVSDRRYAYLSLCRQRLAGHGERLPIGAIVLLDRLPGTPSPSLTRLSPGDGLLQLLSQSLAGDADTHDPGRLVPRLLPMMQGLPCRSLCYDDPMAAVERVVEGLDEGAPAPVSVAPALGAAEVASAAGAPEVAWRRLPVAAEYPLGEEHFLVTGDGGVHRLSAVAGGVWRLLGLEALSLAEVAALLAERFPEVEPARLRADLARLFDDLAAAGLIERDFPA